MKSVLVIIDGLGDEANSKFNFSTPLQNAFTPNIHFIATRGQIGRINTVFDGFPIESMVCIMGLLGYEPESFYPSGRASFEALAKGIPLQPEDLVLRCNLISLKENKISDFTAGLISDSDAKKVISKIKLPHSNWELYPGQSYRNTLIIRGAGIDAKDIHCYEPHMNIGGSVEQLMPYHKKDRFDRIIGELNTFLLDSISQIQRMDLPENCTADMLWVWSPSVKPVWPSFRSRTGLKAAFVGALDFLHGIAMAADIHFDVIPGATGYIDTDYQAKGRYAVAYLDDYDFLLVHVNAADEEAHQLNFSGKVEAIEKTDRYVIGPLLAELEKKFPNDFRIVVCGDHETRSTDGKHGNAPVPYAIYGAGIEPSNKITLSEEDCLQYPPINSIEFLNKIFQYA